MKSPLETMGEMHQADRAQHEYDSSMLEAAEESLLEHMARIKELEAALAQPAQEPDYWLGYGLQAHIEKPFDDATPLYTAPPQREWNAALDEAAARIGEIKGFGKATQDSFAVYIKGLKK